MDTVADFPEGFNESMKYLIDGRDTRMFRQKGKTYALVELVGELAGPYNILYRGHTFELQESIDKGTEEL